MNGSLDSPAAPEEPDNHGYEKEHDKDDKQNLGYARKSRGQTAKSEDCGRNRQ